MGDPVDIIVPKWFVQFIAACFAILTLTALPWCIWQTRVSMRMEVQMENIVPAISEAKEVPLLKQRILNLEKRVDKLVDGK